jgi:opacity protein-like surface antigen
MLLVTLSVCLVPVICSVTPPRPGAYVSGFLGITVPKDTGVVTAQNGSFFSDQVEFDPGIDIGGTGGYDFGFVRLEGELSYKHGEIKNISDSATGVSYGNPDGSLGALAMLANCFIDLHNATPITPYVGGGLGFAVLHLSDTFATVGATRQQFYDSDDDTVFAYQAGAGLDLAINRRYSLDLGYRYFATDKAHFSRGFNDSRGVKFESHNVAVGFRVKF